MKNEEHANFVTWLDTQNTRAWKGAIIHHSLTEDGDVRDMDAIKLFHTSYRVDGKIYSKDEYWKRKASGKGHLFQEPWKDVAYQFLVERVNKQIFWERGRPLDESGAHAIGYNDTHIGICIVGNFDLKDPYDTPIWDFTLEVVRVLLQKYEFTVFDVLGHRETFTRRGVPVEKSCPGNLWDMVRFRQDLTIAPPPAKKDNDDFQPA